MRALTLAVAFLGAAVVCLAGDQPDVKGVHCAADAAQRDFFYCQPPAPTYYAEVGAIGGVTGSPMGIPETIALDDVPDEFTGRNVTTVQFDVVFAGYLAGLPPEPIPDPDGITLSFYSAECPPAASGTPNPYRSHYFGWGGLDKETLYDDPFNCRVWRVCAHLPEPVCVLPRMSIGFQVYKYWYVDVGDVIDWGVRVTSTNDIYGCGCAYQAVRDWGSSDWNWSPVSSCDIAYCLGEGGNPHISMTNCYNDGPLVTIYDFSATAGASPVNDIEVRAYVGTQDVEIISCSVPTSWTCHFEPGNRVHYETLDNPILQGDTYGPFDIWVRWPGCFGVLTVVWTFTYDGQIVAGPAVAYFQCGPSKTEPTTWGAIKAMYRQ